jgi:uncharacterized protein (DUF1697 family)
MVRYVAFLRAINVGGHTVRMEVLCRLFESFGFSNVETFIASGNVIFHADTHATADLEIELANRLRTVLGYDVAVFLRTAAELAQIAAYQPFPKSKLEESVAFNIAFLACPADDLAKQKLMALTTDIDEFAIHKRQVYWLCRKKQSESTISNALLEKTLGVQSTLRGINTVRKLAARVAEPVPHGE